MASFNKVTLLGHLTRDPQLKNTTSATVSEFGIAMNRKWRTPDGQDREEVTFVDVTAFGKTAETVNQYFTKGKPILIEGRLKYDQWEDKNGGGKRSKLSVVLESFVFVGGDGGEGGSRGNNGTSNGNSGNAQGQRRPPAARPPQQQRATAPAQAPFQDNGSFDDGDIPF